MFSKISEGLTNMLTIASLGARLSWTLQPGWVFEPAIESGTASTTWHFGQSLAIQTG
jgi:hypothetical protein